MCLTLGAKNSAAQRNGAVLTTSGICPCACVTRLQAGETILSFAERSHSHNDELMSLLLAYGAIFSEGNKESESTAKYSAAALAATACYCVLLRICRAAQLVRGCSR